jgi:hypothetical protein
MTVLNTANKLYVGTSLVSKAYAGTNLVWPTLSDADRWANVVVAAGGTVSGTRKGHVNTLIEGLKTDGVWAKLDRIWIFAAENAKSALIDLKGLATATSTGGIAPSFTADRGYTGNAAGGYIDTSFVPATNGVTYTLNSAHMAVWDNTNRAAATEAQTGCNDGVGLCDLLSYTGVFGPVGLGFRLNGGGAALTSGQSNGFFIAQRTASNALEGFLNGTSTGTGTAASASPPTVAFYVCARNDNGTPVIPTNDQVSATSYGGSLTSTQAANYYTRMRTYMTAVGVP